MTGSCIGFLQEWRDKHDIDRRTVERMESLYAAGSDSGTASDLSADRCTGGSIAGGAQLPAKDSIVDGQPFFDTMLCNYPQV